MSVTKWLRKGGVSAESMEKSLSGLAWPSDAPLGSPGTVGKTVDQNW
jgi:hypothetical protein